MQISSKVDIWQKIITVKNLLHYGAGGICVISNLTIVMVSQLIIMVVRYFLSKSEMFKQKIENYCVTNI